MVKFTDRSNKLEREEIVRRLLAAGEVKVLPPQLWPLEAALEQIAMSSSCPSLAEDVDSWRSVRRSGRFPGLDTVLRGLVETKELEARGSGVSARYEVTADAWQSWRRELEGLSPPEQQLLSRSGHRLKAFAEMSSK